jgi:hypothetical protein
LNKPLLEWEEVVLDRALETFKELKEGRDRRGQSYLMDDGPGLFSDTLETWECYLSELKKLPDTVANRQSLIESAEQKIALKKRHGV